MFVWKQPQPWGGLALSVYPRLDIDAQFSCSLSLPSARLDTVFMSSHSWKAETQEPVPLADSHGSRWQGQGVGVAWRQGSHSRSLGDVGIGT